MHTSEVSACATSTAASQVLSYLRKGYTGIIVTDHFINGNSTCPAIATWESKMRHFVSGYENALAASRGCGVDVFLGWEYSIHGLDFLTYGLGFDFLLAHPNLDKLPIEAYSALVRENGGYIAQAHPYRTAWYIEYSMPVDAGLLDGIEAYNASDLAESNYKALDFAYKHGLPVQAGSDSHSAAHPHYSGIRLERRAGSIKDIIDDIKSGAVKFL